MKRQQQTLNSCVQVVWKRECPPSLTKVERVKQAKLNGERLHWTWEIDLKVHGLPPPMALSYFLHMETCILHGTLDLKDLNIEHA